MESSIVYLNDNDEIVDKEQVTRAIISEYDDKGNLINETFAQISNEESHYDFEDDAISYEEKMRLFEEDKGFLRK